MRNYCAEDSGTILYHNMGVDMIIATPHLLASIADWIQYRLIRVGNLVIDGLIACSTELLSGDQGDH